MLPAENKYKIPKELLAKDFIVELTHSLLFFEDNAHFPWVILVPKKEAKNMLGLTTEERIEIMKEMEKIEQIMQNLFNPDQINIAIFGNKTPRLHIHIIARFKADITFPSTAFEIASKGYEMEEKSRIIQVIKSYFE